MNAGLQFMLMSSMTSSHSAGGSSAGGSHSGGAGSPVRSGSNWVDSDEDESDEDDDEDDDESEWDFDESDTSDGDDDGYEQEQELQASLAQHARYVQTSDNEMATDADEHGNLAGFVVDDIEYEDAAPKKKRSKRSVQKTRPKQMTAAAKARAERVEYKRKQKQRKRSRAQQLKLFERMVGSLMNEPVKLRTQEEALFVQGVRVLTKERDPDKGYCSDTGVERARSFIRSLGEKHTTRKLLSVVRRDSDGKPRITVECLPDFAKCPITQDLLKEPMTDTVSGHTFEKDAIVKWLRINPVNPLTRAPLDARNLFLNRPLQKALQLLV